MRTMKIEIDGKSRDAQVFETMWEYISHYGTTVEGYEIAPAENVGDKQVASFRPVDDVFFYCSDLYSLGGREYRHVNWGEDEISLIPEREVAATLWTIYTWSERMAGYYESTGQIFETEEEARNAMGAGGQ